MKVEYKGHKILRGLDGVDMRHLRPAAIITGKHEEKQLIDKVIAKSGYVGCVFDDDDGVHGIVTMIEVYFEVRVTDKGGTEIHSCGTLEEIYDIVAGAVIGSTQAVQKQLGRGDEFSAAGVNMFMSKLMHYAQRDMTNTRCSIVLPMGFKKGGDERGRY